MESETPTVTIGSDMSPEMFVDVSTALGKMGVVVKADHLEQSAQRTRVIVVLSPKGGSGKTAVATNLALSLAERHPGRVVAVDLDLQFGDLGAALSLKTEHTLAQLARANQIDVTAVKLHLTAAPSDLFVLAGATDPVDADSVAESHVSAVLPVLERNFDFVIVDTPAGLDGRTLAALDCATDVLLVSSLDVSSIRSMRTACDALDQLGVKAERLLVLNRCDSQVGLNPSDAEDVLNMKIASSIPSTREMPLSLNLGKPVVINAPKSQVAKQFRRLADVYAPASAPKTRKGWLRR